MYRRQPTRIELKLDDLQEYEALKKEWDDKGTTVCSTLDGSCSGKGVASNADSPGSSPKKPSVHERIGYKPEPRVAS
uniref:Anaphase-promoting complex subunit CDC26 n=2 Tax=Amblyomma TaxID=6942 RepID=G3MST2_AMBMU